jgi:hypothetical protein
MLVVVLAAALLAPPAAIAFSFTEEEQRDHDAAHHERARRREAAGGGAGIGAACRAELAKHKTVIVVAERAGDGLRTDQTPYGPHFQVLSRGLRDLGVRTFTQEEIRAQIAQGEVDAYFRNDPDGALEASRKLGADLVVRGVISSRSVFNEFMGLSEIAVTTTLTLADASGQVIAESGASADSYSGYDTLAMSLRLMNENAAGVLVKLFRDYCGQRAGAGER